MSPTRLQAWARCPFQHFLSSVLGIAALETPEETDVITALDKGSLVHGILEEFLSEAIAKGPPKPDEPWSAADHARLRQIAQGAFADVEARGLAGRPLLWSLERDAILDDLAEFLRADSGMRKELGSTPWRVEMAFGFEADGPGFDEHEEGGLTLAFRGLIDRVDKTADGGALVLDYKTGGASFYSGLEDDPVDHGKLLQLPVYGLAAREVLGEDAVIRSAYWFVSEKGGFVRRPRAPLSLEAAMPRFREVVGTIASGIAAGYFPANPGPAKGNCRFCDFDRVCPSRRDAVWERKRKDARLAGYVALADGDAAAEGEGAQ
ncbi:MAG: PD-(D/E)XK nuclease family protein, partial [Dehalococcoidia bacterium]